MNRTWMLRLAAIAYVVPATGLLNTVWHLSNPQGVALGIVAMALVCWVSEAVPLFVTGAGIALLGAATLAPALGVPGETFVTPFASDVSLLFLGGFVLSEVMRAHGLDQVLARRVLDRVGTRPDRVVGGVLVTTAGLSMWMSNSAAAAMMLGLLGALLAPIPKGDPLRKALVVAVAAGANFGGMGTPIGTPPNAVAMASLERTATAPPSFVGWVLLAAPVVLVALYGAWRLLLSWFPSNLQDLGLPGEAPPFTPGARAAAWLTGGTVLLWLTGGLHPLTPGTVGLVPLLLAFGGGLLPPEALRTLPWDVLGVVGGGLCLGVIVDQSGLDAWIISGLPLGGLGTVAVIALLTAIASVLSSVMSNTAAANLLLPLALAIPTATGLPMALSVAFACSAAMVLPVSTPPNTLAFGTGELTAREFTRVGLALTALGLMVILLLGLPWWWLVGWMRS